MWDLLALQGKVLALQPVPPMLKHNPSRTGAKKTKPLLQ